MKYSGVINKIGLKWIGISKIRMFMHISGQMVEKYLRNGWPINGGYARFACTWTHQKLENH